MKKRKAWKKVFFSQRLFLSQFLLISLPISVRLCAWLSSPYLDFVSSKILLGSSARTPTPRTPPPKSLTKELAQKISAWSLPPFNLSLSTMLFLYRHVRNIWNKQAQRHSRMCLEQNKEWRTRRRLENFDKNLFVHVYVCMWVCCMQLFDESVKPKEEKNQQKYQVLLHVPKVP